MHPMRVEWTEPDYKRRHEATAAMADEQARVSRGDFGAHAEMEDLRRELALAHPSERAQIWHSRHPGLSAVKTFYGTLLSVRYVPAQFGVVPSARAGSVTVQMSEAKWVALVATDLGTQEMDPTKLIVKWPLAGGDPIGGTIGSDVEVERARRVVAAADAEGKGAR